MTIPSVRPDWRDDDAGSGRGVLDSERFDMLLYVADLQIDLARGNANYLEKLLYKIEIYDQERREKIFSMISDYSVQNNNDERCEILREVLREKIYWHLNYAKDSRLKIRQTVSPLKKLYKTLEPKNIIIRYQWLFNSSNIKLPIWFSSITIDKINKEHVIVKRLQVYALKKIYNSENLIGITKIASLNSNSACLIGYIIPDLNLSDSKISQWLIQAFEQKEDWVNNLMSSFLHRLATSERIDFITNLLSYAHNYQWSPEIVSNLLNLAPFDKNTWAIVDIQPQKTQDVYWMNWNHTYLRSQDKADYQMVVEKLLSYERPRSAFLVSQYHFDKISAELLANVLTQISNMDHEKIQLEEYYLQEAIKKLENSSLNKEVLINLEIKFFDALERDSCTFAKSLYNHLLSTPSFFVECLSTAFKADNSIEPTNSDENNDHEDHRKQNALLAWKILHNCKRIPGQKDYNDSIIDEQLFISFTEEVLRLSQEASRLEICKSQLGNILSHAPSDSDGLWPCKVVRQLLDKEDMENMRDGFFTGTLNKRGVTSRSMYEGGEQEIDLANKFDALSKKVEISEPFVAETLKRIANSYRYDADQEYQKALLRQEY